MAADPSSASSVVICFDLFELDPKSALLRRSGLPVDLPPQALRILFLLVSRPNELVTRKEIKEALWPGESHGDFDSRLNFTVKKLREGLGDNAEQPRYVQTVRNSGYIFIAPVRSCCAAAPNRSDYPIRILQTQSEFTRDAASAAPHPLLRLSPAVVLIVVLAVGSMGAMSFLLRPQGVRPADQSAQRAHPQTLSNLDGADGVPQISYVSPIIPQGKQRIVIRGRGFGLHVPYARTDSPFLAIRDKTADWAAGRIVPQNYDDVMLDVDSWTDQQIVVAGFSGRYGRNGWKLVAGDRIEVAVWNPQTGTGPATFRLSVVANEH
jgi:DNA-binding winged helix-turn-helix (wHTH) protein